MSPERVLGELDGEGRVVLGDLEAGTGTLLRLAEGQADVVVVVAQPTAKALDVARRAARIAQARGARVVAIANRVRDEEDRAAVTAALEGHEVVVVPDDPAVLAADEQGVAPVDAAPDAPAVRALLGLADRLAPAAPGRC